MPGFGIATRVEKGVKAPESKSPERYLEVMHDLLFAYISKNEDCPHESECEAVSQTADRLGNNDHPMWRIRRRGSGRSRGYRFVYPYMAVFLRLEIGMYVVSTVQRPKKLFQGGLGCIVRLTPSLVRYPLHTPATQLLGRRYVALICSL